MNYIKLISDFWAYHRLIPFSPLEIALYFGLIEEANRQFWPESFRVPPRFANCILQRSAKTICEVRQRLIDKGFIAYSKKDNIGFYSIIERDTPSNESPAPEGKRKSHPKGNSQSKQTPKNTPVCHPESNPKASSEGNTQGNPEGEQNEISTSYIENKNKNKNISLSYPSQTHIHTENKINLPTPEQTFREYRQSAKSREYSNFLAFLEESAPFVASHLITISEDQFFILRKEFGPTMIGNVVTNLENRRDLCSRYSHMYYTIKNWCINETKRLTIA